MTKTYTAQEMREMADKLDDDHGEYAICHYDERDDEWRPLWMKPNSAVLALRQAADVIEREERRKSSTTTDYSFVDESGFRVPYLYDSVETAKRGAAKFGYDAKCFIRREVGNWEEVKDGD